jgi:hypothetical protein
MKKIITVVCICLTMFFIAFRIKDNKVEKPLQEGFWKGYWYIYNAALLNRKDGTSRLYLLFLNDTSSAYKYDGKWNVNSRAFNASYAYGNERLYLNGINRAAGIMKGNSIHKELPAASFNFVKEQ